MTSDSCAAERGVDLDRHCYGDFSSSLMVTIGVEIAEPCLVLNLKAAGYEGLRIHESFIAHDHLRACGSALRAFRRKVITCHDAREKRAERDFLPTDFEKQMTQTRCYTNEKYLQKKFSFVPCSTSMQICQQLGCRFPRLSLLLKALHGGADA